MIFNENDAYQELAKTILDFIKGRKFDKGVCKCEIFTSMTSMECWLEKDGNKDTISLDWFDSNLLYSDAAFFLRDKTLKETGNRIWGLLFTLYPDGRFEVEYDYNKPEGYEETDDLITGDEINQSLGNLSS